MIYTDKEILNHVYFLQNNPISHVYFKIYKWDIEENDDKTLDRFKHSIFFGERNICVDKELINTDNKSLLAELEKPDCNIYNILNILKINVNDKNMVDVVDDEYKSISINKFDSVDNLYLKVNVELLRKICSEEDYFLNLGVSIVNEDCFY